MPNYSSTAKPISIKSDADMVLVNFVHIFLFWFKSDKNNGHFSLHEATAHRFCSHLVKYVTAQKLYETLWRKMEIRFYTLRIFP